jgi:hypothetical protein
MYHYFTPTPTTIDEAKSLYRKLARQHHPDMGGSTEAMQAVNAEYAAVLADLTRTTERARQAQAHKEGKKTAADYHDLDEVAEQLRQVIEALLNLEGVEVELCGLWVWASGDTRPHKEQLKALGLRWSPDKVAWYYPGVPSFNRKRRTMDEIRNMHGSQRFARQPAEEEAARQPLPA